MARSVETMAFSLPRDVADHIVQRAKTLGISRSSYVTMVLRTVFMNDAELQELRRIYQIGNSHVDMERRPNNGKTAEDRKRRGS